VGPFEATATGLRPLVAVVAGMAVAVLVVLVVLAVGLETAIPFLGIDRESR
jgi:hypothetical protein